MNLGVNTCILSQYTSLSHHHTSSSHFRGHLLWRTGLKLRNLWNYTSGTVYKGFYVIASSVVWLHRDMWAARNWFESTQDDKGYTYLSSFGKNRLFYLATFGGAFGLSQSFPPIVMYSVLKCTRRRRHPWGTAGSSLIAVCLDVPWGTLKCDGSTWIVNAVGTPESTDKSAVW